MNQDHVGNLTELRPILRTALPDFDPAMRDGIIRELTSELPVVPEPQLPAEDRAINVSLTEPDTYYAVHDTDLNFLKEASTVAAAFAAGIPHPVAVISGLVVFLFRYRRKRIRLNAEQALLLRALRHAPGTGWTPEEVSAELTSVKQLDPAAVSHILHELRSISQTDGTLTALVGEQAGRWRTLDV